MEEKRLIKAKEVMKRLDLDQVNLCDWLQKKKLHAYSLNTFAPINFSDHLHHLWLAKEKIKTTRDFMMTPKVINQSLIRQALNSVVFLQADVEAFENEIKLEVNKQNDGLQRETESKHENIFRKNGDIWEIAFQGSKIFHLSDSIGLKYIQFLLGRPNQTVPSITLTQMDRIDPGTIQPTKGDHRIDYNQMGRDELEEKEIMKKDRPGSSCDTIISPKGLLEYKKRLREIEEELNTTDNPEEKVLLEEEKKEIEKQLKDQKTSIIIDSKKPRQAVGKAISEAKQKIEQHSPELKKYLDQTVKTGNKCIYHLIVEKPITWTF
jgi:hypothetical protein